VDEGSKISDDQESPPEEGFVETVAAPDASSLNADIDEPAGPAQLDPSASVAEAPAAAQEPRQLRLRGLHHITLICSDLSRTVSFYRDLLGLSLLKESFNPDDPQAKHFYFGDPEATPGTMITFLEYPNMEHGQVGVGATHHFALRVGSIDELEGWHAHLTAHGVQCTEPIDRTYFSSIYFRDPDGHIIEVATDGPGLVID
jgi:catechol 2,3-dioxygenase-like lactoylglutathione lyase family enzyme